MFNKMLTLLGTAGLLTVTALCAGPVKAEPQELILSQLRGHETYRQEPQMDPTQYVLGRVRGTVGGIMSIELMRAVTVDGKDIMAADLAPYGTSQRVVGDAMGGDDVILQVVDGKLVYIGKAHPYWISRLKLKSEASYSGNTARLIEELNRSEASVGLPPLAPETRTFTAEPAPAPAPAVAPVRGLW